MLRQVTSLGEKQHSCTSAKRVRSLTLLKLFLPINRHTSSKALSVPFHSLHTPSIKSSTVSVLMLSLSLSICNSYGSGKQAHTHKQTHTYTGTGSRSMHGFMIMHVCVYVFLIECV